MTKADICYLVKENPSAHGVLDAPAEVLRMVYCKVRSVGMSEFYRAKESNIEPDIVFELSDYTDYEGEKVLIYNNKRYRVVRTYIASQKIEITCEVATNDR